MTRKLPGITKARSYMTGKTGPVRILRMIHPSWLQPKAQRRHPAWSAFHGATIMTELTLPAGTRIYFGRIWGRHGRSIWDGRGLIRNIGVMVPFPNRN